MNDQAAMDTSEPPKEQLKETILLVQHDWNNAKLDTGESFFVGRRKFGEKTKFHDITLNKETKAFQNETLNCKKLPNRMLSLEFKELKIQKVFVSPYAEYDIHKSAVTSLDVSKSGNLCLSTDSTSGLLVWKAENAEVLREFEGHIMDVNCCRFFPSGMVVLSGGIDMTVRVWSVETGECPRVLKGHKAPILDLAFLGRGEEVLSAARDGTVRKWSCGANECLEIANLPTGSPTRIQIDADKPLLNIATDSGHLYNYDLKSKGFVSDVNLGYPCSSLSIHGDYAFVGGENTISVVDLRKNSVLQRLKIDRGLVQKLSATDTGLIASFADGAVCFYDNPRTSAQSKVEFTGADIDPVYDFAFTSSYLFTACRDKIVRKYLLDGVFN